MPRRLTQTEFVERARFLHDDKYDYSLARYTNNKAFITVICPIHGEFQVRAGRHITIREGKGGTNAMGCTECWRDEHRWTEEKLYSEAKKYKFRVDFQRGSKGAYLSAFRKGILQEVCAHMERQLVEKGHWNLENCLTEALKYDARGKFMRGSASAYNVALREGWLDQICSHMIKGADGYHYMAYAIINRRLEKAYVGITKQQFNQRMKLHKKGGSTRAEEIAKLDDTEFLPLTEYVLLSTEVKDAEKKWAEHFSSKGFKVLNNEKQFGSIGASKRIYTDEVIAIEAKKYASRGEFKSQSPRHYDAACSQKILNKVCAHMRSIKPKNYWTKSRCIEAALKCSDRSEFTTNQTSAYEAAQDNGWLEEIWETTGLRSRMDMTWLRPGVRKEIWLKADYYYNLWTENEKCGTWRMKTITGINLNKLLKKFKSGWIPQKDKEWQEWANQYGK